MFCITLFSAPCIFFILRNTMSTQTDKSDIMSQLSLRSTSFENQGAIPSKYTCDGENSSPQLSWSYHDTQVSTTDTENTQKITSYVLVVDDPDAQSVVGKTFVHWIALLPHSITELPEGISGAHKSSLATLDNEAREVVNDSKEKPYYGPCPPNGTHTYRFTLFATTQPVKDMNSDFFKSPFTAEQFRENMKESILTEALLTGTYIKRDTSIQ